MTTQSTGSRQASEARIAAFRFPGGVRIVLGTLDAEAYISDGDFRTAFDDLMREEFPNQIVKIVRLNRKDPDELLGELDTTLSLEPREIPAEPTTQTKGENHG